MYRSVITKLKNLSNNFEPKLSQRQIPGLYATLQREHKYIDFILMNKLWKFLTKFTEAEKD